VRQINTHGERHFGFETEWRHRHPSAILLLHYFPCSVLQDISPVMDYGATDVRAVNIGPVNLNDVHF
jgi:hypothetical protein